MVLLFILFIIIELSVQILGFIYILNKIIIKNFNLFFCRNKMEWISYNELCEVEIFLQWGGIFCILLNVNKFINQFIFWGGFLVGIKIFVDVGKIW